VTADFVLALFRGFPGIEQLLTGPEDLISYGFDGTAALKQRPLAVLVLRTSDEVAVVFKVAGRIVFRS